MNTEFVFNERDKLLTKKQQEDVNKYFESGSTVDLVHTGADGGKRRIIFIRIPRGAITPKTEWGGRDKIIESHEYYTPGAIGTEKFIALLYIDMATDERCHALVTNG